MLLDPESLVLFQCFQPKFSLVLSPPGLCAVYVILLDLITLIIFEEDVDDLKD